MTVERPRESHKGGLHRYTWPERDVEVKIERVRRGYKGIDGQITLGVNGRMLHQAHIGLTSMSSRESTYRKLKRAGNDEAQSQWEPIIDMACILTVQALDKEDEAVDLRDFVNSDDPDWLLWPFVMDREVNLWFADGGSLKSYFALATAIAIEQEEEQVLGLPPVRSTRPLYLDWESNPETHGRRVSRIWSALPYLRTPSITYKRCHRPLTDMADSIKQLVARLDIGLTIIDSKTYAAGGEIITDEAVAQMTEACRYIGGAFVVLDHVTKGESGGKSRGTGMWYNWARNVWEMKPEQEGRVSDGEVHRMNVGFYHRKINDGAKFKPRAYRVSFDNTEGMGSTMFEKTAIEDSPELSGGLPLKMQIANELKSGEMTAKDLAEVLQSDVRTVGARLREGSRGGQPMFVRLGKQGNEQLWALGYSEN